MHIAIFVRKGGITTCTAKEKALRYMHFPPHNFSQVVRKKQLIGFVRGVHILGPAGHFLEFKTHWTGDVLLENISVFIRVQAPFHSASSHLSLWHQANVPSKHQTLIGLYMLSILSYFLLVLKWVTLYQMVLVQYLGTLIPSTFNAKVSNKMSEQRITFMHDSQCWLIYCLLIWLRIPNKHQI